MIEFLGTLALLLVPVLLILIVRLRRRQKLRFSHTYLRSFQDNRLRDFLFRSFQLYHDVLFDLLLAVVLALLLSGLVGERSPNRVAVVLDGSYSMLQAEGGTGEAAQTPLDRALGLIKEGRVEAERYRLYLLGFDPARGRPALFRLRQLQKSLQGGASAAAAAEQLVREHLFLSADRSLLSQLYRRGFGRVIFLTDRSLDPPSAVEVVEVGEGRRAFFYPLSTSYDYTRDLFRLLILRQGYGGALRVERFEDAQGAYRAYTAAEEPVVGSLPAEAGAGAGEESAAGRNGGLAAEPPGPPASGNGGGLASGNGGGLATGLTAVEIAQEGLYRLSGGGLSFVLPLARPRIRVRAQGPYSQLLLEVLPDAQQVEEGPAAALLADLPYRPEDIGGIPRRIRSLGRYPQKLVTLIPAPAKGVGRRGTPSARTAQAATPPPPPDPCLYPLELSFSQPVYTEVPQAVLGLPSPRGTQLFYQDPARVRDAGAPLLYLQSLLTPQGSNGWGTPAGPDTGPTIRNAAPQPAASTGGKLSPERGGSSSYVYEGRTGLTVVNPPAEEFFPVASSAPPLPDPVQRRGRTWPAFLLLLALYLAKLVFLYRFRRGKGQAPQVTPSRQS
jgi:hypothetical protein